MVSGVHGYWVAGDETRVIITPALLAENDLCPDSGWTLARQNAQPARPHGFVCWADARADVERRLGLGRRHPPGAA